MAAPDPAPESPREIERIPFTRLGTWAANQLWAHWFLFVVLIWSAAGGLYLLFAFAGTNADIRFPELMYGLGMLLVVVGLQLILLDLLAEHHRANIRLYAEIGTETQRQGLTDEDRHDLTKLNELDDAGKRLLLEMKEIEARKVPDLTLNYNAVLDAVRTLPLARLLIVAGIVTMFLGACVDDLWDIPNVTFTTEGTGGTPES